MPTHPSLPFSHAHTRTHHQPDYSPPGLAQWACYIKASAYGFRVGWTPAQRIHTYIHGALKYLNTCLWMHCLHYYCNTITDKSPFIQQKTKTANYIITVKIHQLSIYMNWKKTSTTTCMCNVSTAPQIHMVKYSVCQKWVWHGEAWQSP